MQADPPGDWTNTTVIGGVVSTLVGAIVFLVKFINARYEKEVTELRAMMNTLVQHVDECEKDRLVIHAKFSILEANLKKDKKDEPEKSP